MPPKRKRWSATERRAIWTNYMGNVERGSCLCCGSEPITVKNFDIGHVIAFSRGGSDEMGNLRPVCGHCNNSMGTQHMAVYQAAAHPGAVPIFVSEDPVGDVCVDMATAQPVVSAAVPAARRPLPNWCVIVVVVVAVVILVAIFL